MDEITLILQLQKTDTGYGIWLSDELGGSGIGVLGTTKEACAEQITPYITDYLYRLDNEQED